MYMQIQPAQDVPESGISNDTFLMYACAPKFVVLSQWHMLKAPVNQAKFPLYLNKPFITLVSRYM